MSLTQKVNTAWRKMVGAPANFSIEGRIYHSVWIIAFLSLFILVLLNFIFGFYSDGIIDIVLIALGAIIFYLSRVRNLFELSFVIFAVLIIVLFVGCYFIDAGVRGPNDLQVLLYLTLVICVTPRRQRLFWLFTFITINIGLHVIEYYQPQWVQYHYPDRKSQFNDICLSFLVVSLIIYFTINYLRINYNIEKRISDERELALKHQYDQIMTQKAELEHINSEKDKLMSIVAHDLRSPLSNILNYIELITKYEVDSDERKTVEANLFKVTQSTMNMLSKLLLWSKTQMDGVVVELKPVHLWEVLNNSLELEKALASKKNISLFSNINKSLVINADCDMLQIVIRNLVNNAIKFTPAGGSILVDASQIGQLCRISVRDSGSGIAYEQQSSLFSLKARSTYGTDNEKGVGLGLLLCKEFIEKQGGTIGFESIPGKGTTFFVELELMQL